MEGPLTVVLRLSHATEMILAAAIGFGFGFVLERAGFGRADRLAAVFYGRDFRVLRVMFGAIVTAMVGLHLLDVAGALPIASIGILDTYLWPQLVGGLLLGAGFILGGYCPGTSVVAAVSGKVDAVLFLAGLLGGSMLFTLAWPDLAAFAASGARGRLMLYDVLGVPSGVVVFGVAALAVAAFWGVGKIERAVRARLPARAAAPEPSAAEPAGDLAAGEGSAS
jgi:uncharacterized membrane protein YedE/YeeE